MTPHPHICRITVIAALALACSANVFAANASEVASSGAVMLAASPLASVNGGPLKASQYFVGGATFLVLGLAAVGLDVVEVVLERSVDGSKAVVSASADAARQVGVATGQAVHAVSTATGYALVASGKFLAFVPNEIGQQLLHQTRLSP